jgi:putative phosphoribosyl transferase
MKAFADREQAGRQLAELVDRYREERPIVLALPRGGVAVGREVARALGAPLDVLIVRKLGAPLQPELGMGAVAEGGATFLDPRVVDDGIATGGTVRAAVRALRARGAGKIVVAAPVAAAETVRILAAEADEVVCVLVPEDLWAIGYWYRDFRQVSDEEVVAMLEQVRGEGGRVPGEAGPLER